MKRIVNITIIGIILGLSLFAIQHIFQIPKDIFLHYYWIFGVVVIVGSVLFNQLYILKYYKKMKEAIPLLESGKTREYMQVVETLRRRAKGRYLNHILTVNLSVGYCDLNEYGKAIELLESLSNARLYGILKAVYRINICTCYFYDDQIHKAMTVYEDSQKVFKPYRDSKLYGGNIAVLDIFAAIEKGERSRADALMKSAIQMWNTPRLQNDYRYLAQRLQQC